MPDCYRFRIYNDGKNRRLQGFTIPHNACGRCQSEARDAFARRQPETGLLIALQDRKEDLFESK